MDESDIGRELADAQADYIKVRGAVREAGDRRRKAVALARTKGWSKYKIGATLGVKGPTVDSIISAAERERDKQ
jgi:DNA-directed RNA polymerase specialized sigma24 family protein